MCLSASRNLPRSGVSRFTRDSVRPMKNNDSNMTPELRTRIFAHLEQHTETLRSIHLASVERAEKYLVITNGGGVIATLSFLGAMPELRHEHVAWLILWFFVVGVILCGVLVAANYHLSATNLLRWIRNTDSFGRGEIHIEDVSSALWKPSSWLSLLPIIAGYLAFGAFVTACALAIFKLRP